MGEFWASLGARVLAVAVRERVVAWTGQHQVSVREGIDKVVHAGIDQSEREHERGMPCHGMASFCPVGMLQCLAS
jgi:hypothetical protein